MALVKPAERSSTPVHRWRECLNGNSAEIPKGIFKMTFLVRAAACQRPSIRTMSPRSTVVRLTSIRLASARAVDRESIGNLPNRSEAGGIAQRTIWNSGP